MIIFFTPAIITALAVLVIGLNSINPFAKVHPSTLEAMEKLRSGRDLIESKVVR